MSSKAAPQELNRLEVLRGLRIATWEAVFATSWASLTAGAFLTGFALWLGANSVVMALVTAIPTFAGLVQIPSSYLGERLSERKRFTAWFSLLGRALWLPILLLPLILPSSMSLVAFLILLALSYIALNIPIPAYMSWMSDLVPSDHRGRYFGRRNMMAGIVGMAIGLPAAWFLDFTTKRHSWHALGFGVLFGIGVLGGVLSFLCLLRQPEPPKRSAPSTLSGGFSGALAYYRAPFTDRNFRSLMLFNTMLAVGQNFAAPFFTVYALQKLNLDFVWLQVLATLNSVTSLASMPLWGYLTDKFGNKPLLAIGVVGVSTLPITWFFTTLDKPAWTLALLIEVHLLGGLSWACVQLAQFNLLIRLSPPEKTPVYVATMAAATGLVGGLAPLAGGAVMRGLNDWTGTLFGMTLLNFHVAFFLSGALRLVSLLFLHPVTDAQAASARDVLHQLTRSTPRTWLHMRQLQRGSGEKARRRATEALGESRALLAVDELRTALSDPSYTVRTEAARALGEIGDPGSVDALRTALHDTASTVAEEAARALGRIGDRRANSALLALLQGGSHVSHGSRLAAARALGELGGPDAVEGLLEALEVACDPESGDVEIAETLAHSLGRIGDAQTVPILTARLQRPDTPRPLRFALVHALGELGDPAALDALRATLPEADADPRLLPALADAFARLGDTESALPLLSRLSTLETPVARKQVVNAIGALIGESASVYSLLSQEGFARDGAVSRIAQESQRRHRAAPVAKNVGAARDAYVAGDYSVCLRALNAAAQALPEAPALETERGELCHRILEYLAEFDTPPPVEAVLLAFCALRALSG